MSHEAKPEKRRTRAKLSAETAKLWADTEAIYWSPAAMSRPAKPSLLPEDLRHQGRGASLSGRSVAVSGALRGPR